MLPNPHIHPKRIWLIARPTNPVVAAVSVAIAADLDSSTPNTFANENTIANIILTWGENSCALSPDDEQTKRLVKTVSHNAKREIPYLRKNVMAFLEK